MGNLFGKALNQTRSGFGKFGRIESDPDLALFAESPLGLHQVH